jgi:hypothetical protein
MGIGDGSFEPAVDYATGDYPYLVKAADLNRNGRLDLVVSNYHAGTFSILLGRWNGTFKSGVEIPSGSSRHPQRRPSPMSTGMADWTWLRPVHMATRSAYCSEKATGHSIRT